MKERVSATIDGVTRKQLLEIMKNGTYRNISHVIEEAIKNFHGKVVGGRK